MPRNCFRRVIRSPRTLVASQAVGDRRGEPGDVVSTRQEPTRCQGNRPNNGTDSWSELDMRRHHEQ